MLSKASPATDVTMSWALLPELVGLMSEHEDLTARQLGRDDVSAHMCFGPSSNPFGRWPPLMVASVASAEREEVLMITVTVVVAVVAALACSGVLVFRRRSHARG